jgi:chloramphenicol 3-O phosphotransferase
VLLLIGPSSVGKSSVAFELQRLLPGTWLCAGVDLFWGMIDEADLPAGEFRTDSAVMRRLTRGWHRAVAALAAAGNDVIVDELWTHPWWLEDWRRVLEGFQYWSVMLTAHPDTLAARERARGDRPAGLAARDLVGQPDPASFDLALDTAALTPEECARTIADMINRAERPS